MTDKGIYVANLTAFRDGKLDIDAVRAHSEFLIEAGVAGLCPAGTTGEFLYLSVEEKKTLFSALADVCRGRTRLICCTWDHSRDALAELCRFASDIGADGIFLPPPIYYEFTDAEIIAFYKFVKNNSAVPIYCYNIPKYTNNEIRIAALATMSERGVIAGIKDSSADETRMAEIIARFSGTLDIFAGGDHFVLKAKTLGADGFISALANIYPELFVELWRTSAPDLQERINDLRQAVKGYGGIPALKYLLLKRGFQFGCRFPFRELDERQRKELEGRVP
ncbi:MAG: dihydrodipicolinate synthase family protein [Candidatus Abyssubacteria bacterium]